MKDQDRYYEAMRARDPRFDGKFFVGVKTTGIYCRPVCPAKPKRENVEFFRTHLEAEKAGYRPCMRCRPESAPLSPAWIGTSAVVRRALRILTEQSAFEFDEEQFAGKFGVTARHLRRLFIEEIGKTPKQLFSENRLNLARKLITETGLPITEIAYGSGFTSIRRFNEAFRARFKKAPSQIRRDRITHHNSNVEISISYRPPFDYEGLLATYERHRVGDLEWFSNGRMHRLVSFRGKTGTVSIRNDPGHARLIVTIDFPDISAIQWVITRVRNLFDLDSDPVIIANCLESDRQMKRVLKRYPGIRIATGWDPFEIAIGTILGQLVSVERGRALLDDLIQLAGRDSGFVHEGTPVKLFPTPEAIMLADLSSLKTTMARRQTLINFSKAVASGDLSLEPTQNIEDFTRKVMTIKGIGRWSADYITLKALRDVDTFPHSDLILSRSLLVHSRATIDAMRPWRGYAAALMWRAYSTEPEKKQHTQNRIRRRRVRDTVLK